MNFDDYTNRLVYPRKEHFTTVFVYSGGKVKWTGTAREYSELSNPFSTTGVAVGGVVEKVVDDAAFKAALTHHMRHSADLMARFKQDLKEEFGVTDNPKADAAFKLAYDHGHGSGLSDIYDYFSDFVQLIK